MARPLGDRAGLDEPARPDLSGVDVFISHVEEDQSVALELADGLAGVGCSTWCYERNTIPGPSYLLQTGRAIESSSAVVVLISPDSLGSHQVTSEVVRAHEEGKPFIPLLIGISREEFAARQPEWREAIGSAAMLELPAGGVPAVLPRIVEGLAALSLGPHPQGELHTAPSYGGAGEGAVASLGRPRRYLVPAVVMAILVAVAALVVVLTKGGDQVEQPGTVASTGTTPTTQPTSPRTTSTTSPKDAATTALATDQGPARVTARAVTQYCDLTNACFTAPNGRVFVLLDVTAWNSGDLIYDNALAMAAATSYISYEGQRVSGDRSMLLEGSPAGFTVIYSTLPPEVGGKTVDLSWPQNPPLRVPVKG